MPKQILTILRDLQEVLAQDQVKKVESRNFQNMEIKVLVKILAENQLLHYKLSLKDLLLGFKYDSLGR